MEFSHQNDVTDRGESHFNEVMWTKAKWQCVHSEVSEKGQ